MSGGDEQDFDWAVPPAGEASLDEWVAAARQEAVLSEWMVMLHVRLLTSGLSAKVLKAQFAAVEPQISATWGRVFDAVLAGQVEFEDGDVMRELEFALRNQPRQRAIREGVQEFIDGFVSEAVRSRLSCAVVQCREVDDGSLQGLIVFNPRLGPGALSADELRDLGGVYDRYLTGFEEALKIAGLTVRSRRQGAIEFTIPASMVKLG